MLNISKFIDENITCRQTSIFLNDIKKHTDELIEIVHGKTILVIGGAGSIGSSFIHTILPYKPSKLIVVDISENGLTELTRDLRSSFDLFVPDDYRTYALILPIHFLLCYFVMKAGAIFYADQETGRGNRRGFGVIFNF